MDKTKSEFPAGGVTPVFNEIEAILTVCPQRPDANARFDDLTGPKERVLMKNVIDDSGIVQPTIFVRSPTFVDPQTGLRTQVLSLAACSGVGQSMLLGGDRKSTRLNSSHLGISYAVFC